MGDAMVVVVTTEGVVIHWDGDLPRPFQAGAARATTMPQTIFLLLWSASIAATNSGPVISCARPSLAMSLLEVQG